MFSYVRPLMFAVDPEVGHDLAMRAARFVAAHPSLARRVHDRLARPAYMPRTVAGMEFPNPVGLAAGLDKNAEAPLAWWAFGFGFVEVGTVTPVAQGGQARPRLLRDRRRRALVNRMGFNNHGAAVIAERLARQRAEGLRPPVPLGVSIGKNRATPLSCASLDYEAAARLIEPVADFISINVSSPNSPGLRQLQSHEYLREICRAVRTAAPSRPLFVKLAPELRDDELAGVLQECVRQRVDGVIATNTMLVPPGRYPFEGGLSGPPLHELAVLRVGQIRQLIGKALAVIGCGGIHDLRTAHAMLDAGADLIQLYTALVYEGPFLAARLTRGLAQADG